MPGPPRSPRPGTEARKIDEYLEAVSADPPSLEGNITSVTAYRLDLIHLAERTAAWPDGDWLTRTVCPKKMEIADMLGRGSTHAGNIRRIVEAIRKHVNTTETN